MLLLNWRKGYYLKNFDFKPMDIDVMAISEEVIHHDYIKNRVYESFFFGLDGPIVGENCSWYQTLKVKVLDDLLNECNQYKELIFFIESSESFNLFLVLKDHIKNHKIHLIVVEPFKFEGSRRLKIFNEQLQNIKNINSIAILKAIDIKQRVTLWEYYDLQAKAHNQLIYKLVKQIPNLKDNCFYQYDYKLGQYQIMDY